MQLYALEGVNRNGVSILRCGMDAMRPKGAQGRLLGILCFLCVLRLISHFLLARSAILLP